MKKKLKVILHHQVTDQVTVDKKFDFATLPSKALFGLINLILDFFYFIGLILVNVINVPKWSTQIPKLIPKQFKFQKSIAFVLLVAVAIGPIIFLKTASEGQKLGGRVLGISQGALSDAQSAQDAIAHQNYSLAQNNFTAALDRLKMAKTELDESSIILQSIVKLSPKSFNTENALRAAQLLTESAVLGSELLDNFSKLKISPQGLSHFNDQTPEEILINLKESTQKINIKLSEASSLLEPLNLSVLPAEYQLALTDSRTLVSELSKLTDSLGTATTILADMLLGQKRVLIVLQNNNEIRATGGFIGTIGQSRITNGTIASLDIRSVYDLDGQLTDWLTPPFPLQAVNNRTFLRDSNWFANFSESAKQISLNYERSGGETPDWVMAITPDLFIELLNLTGPITVPSYNVTITAENFVEQIQTSTSVYYDKNLNQPKQLLADLYPALMQRIGEITTDNNLILLELLQKNLANKQILLYSRDEALQQKIESFNWAGKLNDTDRDYLQVNFTNLGGTKTDRFLDREVKLTTTIGDDGTIINNLNYTVTNPLPNDDKLSNRSFIRAYVPNGSKLLAAGGFYTFDLPQLDNTKTYQTDEAIQGWNSNSTFEPAHSVWSGAESNKTYFGGWVEVAGGATKTVTFTYQLPFKLKDLDRYSLLWEKQSGLLPMNIEQAIVYPGRSNEWNNIDGNNRVILKNEDNQSIWNGRLETDNFVGLVLKAKE